MRRFLIAGVIVLTLLTQSAGVTLGTAIRAESTKAQAADYSRTLVSVYVHHMKAVKTKGKMTALSSDEKNEDGVARDFIGSIYSGRSGHIWWDLIPKDQRGATAALLAVDVTGGEPEAAMASRAANEDVLPFNEDVYHGLKNNREYRNAMVRGFKEALSDVSKSGEIAETGVVNDHNAGFVIVKFKDGKDLFVVPVVKDGNEWKADISAFWVISDPSLLLESAYDAGKDMKSSGDKKGAKELLGDLLPLEGVYNRLTEKPYSEAMQPELMGAINDEKPRFNDIRKDYDQVK